ncbi:unnamed protein product, partial [Anisakis simplex]|uniref:Regulatory-associated protein of TOR 1-like n=1 Tax=Anisakis simplex TaxID=6269 RepID=A0A0M3JF72_ANISI
MQAAICLLYSAVRTGSDDIIMSAEHALFHLLRCDPKLLYGWLQSVERIVDGINCGHNGGSILMDAGDISPLFLEAPPSSGDYMSPATSPYPSTTKCLQNCITMTSNYTTPDHQSHNDSGFNSGFSSPAAFFEMK